MFVPIDSTMVSILIAGVSLAFVCAKVVQGSGSTEITVDPKHDVDRGKLAGLEPPPADFGMPLIGRAFELTGSSKSLLLSHRDKSVWRTHVLTKEIAVVTTTEASNKVFKGDGTYTLYSNSFLGLKELGGKSLANLVDPNAHRNMRKSLLQCFRPSTVALSSPALQRLVSRFATKWAKASVFDAQGELAKVAFEAGATFIGLHPELMSEARVAELHKALIDFARALLTLRIDLGQYSAFGRGRKARKVLLAATKEVILECQRKLRAGEDVEDGILRQLVEATDEDGKPYSLEVMQDNLVTFTNAASDTTAATMLSFFLCLCEHPEVQDRAHEHIKEVLGEDSDEFHGRKLLSIEQMNEMTYLDDIISECERFTPPAVACAIRRAGCDIEVGGSLIKKGTDYIVDCVSRTRNPDYFDNPDTFNPDRFTRNPSLRKRLATFGGGKRMCIGNGFANLERKVVAATLLRDYRISFVDKDAAKNVKTLHLPLLTMEGGELLVRIQPRDKS